MADGPYRLYTSSDQSERLKDYAFHDFDADGVDEIFGTRGGRWRTRYVNPISGSLPDWDTINVSNWETGNLGFGNFLGDSGIDVFSTYDGDWRVSENGNLPWAQWNWSAAEFDSLRFADFVGSSKTDVMRSIDGYWEVSDSGHTRWSNLNMSNVQVSHLGFADLIEDEKTDIFTMYGDDWKVSESGQYRWDVLRTEGGVNQQNLAFGNFIGDNKLDIFYADGTDWYVYELDNGSILDRKFIRAAPYRVEDLDFADLDGDGWTDILIMKYQDE